MDFYFFILLFEKIVFVLFWVGRIIKGKILGRMDYSFELVCNF